MTGYYNHRRCEDEAATAPAVRDAASPYLWMQSFSWCNGSPLAECKGLGGS